MFALAANPTFKQLVTVAMPTDAGHEDQTFTGRFSVRGDSEIAGYDLSNRDDTQNFLKLVVAGFDDVVDAIGNPVEYSDATRDLLLDLPFVRIALVKAYFAGMFKAQTGN